MQQQQHNKDNMLLKACWREMQDELQGVRGPCCTSQLMEEVHRVQNILYQLLLSYTLYYGLIPLCTTFVLTQFCVNLLIHIITFLLGKKKIKIFI